MIWVKSFGHRLGYTVTEITCEGAHYPQALGHNDGNDEAMPVEGAQCFDFYVIIAHVRLNVPLESGNMLIMTLSYTRASGDMSLINNYVWSTSTPS